MNKTNKSPWSWIPTLYFAEGIPYVVAMTVAVIMYKRLGISNTDIALYTSWLYLPWVIKPFWSPFVDIIKTKRWWIVTMQLLIGAGLAGVAFLIPMSFFFQATLAVLWLIAFSSATHDIAADGFYMLALDSSQQSFFVGIRSTFYRLAMISGQGLLIILAGSLESSTGLEPLKFEVHTTNSKVIEQQINPTKFTKSSNKEMTFVAYPSVLYLNTNCILPDSLKSIIAFADKQNEKNGFIRNEIQSKPTENINESWWSKYVSIPLGSYLRTHFGVAKTSITPKNTSVGNAGIIQIRISKKPKPNENIVLRLESEKGDKNAKINTELITFNNHNWNKTYYAVVQLDTKPKNDNIIKFKGISGNFRLAWSIIFFILAGMFGLFFIYHRFVLPHPYVDITNTENSSKEIFREFGLTFASFFKKEGIGLAIAFMLLYRLGEAMLVKMASPFLLDTRDVGGLGLSTEQVGLVYGTVGIIALTLGGIVGGIAASRRGLKYWIWPMALSITLPHLAYVYLSWFMPTNFWLINTAVAIEQFGYGFGFTAYMLYLIYFADGEHKTAHYAMCTGFMALGMMLPGMVAGWLQDQIGYQHFFIWIMVLAIPTLAVIPFLKIDNEFGKKKNDHR
ncbi:MAG: MFS transporter [Paludibacter sp.]